MKLLAPRPGWTITSDVIIVGSGIAGLTTARVDEGSTKWAQGGIAAALGPGDSPAEHEIDTLKAGAGLCDRKAVHALVTEGPEAVARLIARGAVFDRGAGGEIALTREGGHLKNRILHAGGDATGAEISRALLAAVTEDPGIEVIEHALVLDALKSESGRVCGVTLHVIGEGTRDGVGRALGKAVILGTGGLGQVFAQTTNPSVSTGDGVALALRAGAEVADVEFIQFHPTVLFLGEKSSGQQPLISEAVRGEGAFLLNDAKEQFMKGLHPLADLAPRDVVAKAIMSQMLKNNAQHVWLDVSKVQNFSERFPNIYQSCVDHGINPEKDLIPVAPAAHYASGGVRVNLSGRSTVPGLYACGETACTGVHGANRLASNSLLEGLVFAARIADDIHQTLRKFTREEPVMMSSSEILISPEARSEIAHAMSAGAGVIRTRGSLENTSEVLERIGELRSDKPCVEAWETTNLHTLATVIVSSALIREETRGSHWREDFPYESEAWMKRILQKMDPSGNLSHRFEGVSND